MAEALSPILPPELEAATHHLLQDACDRELRLATAESCTGGLIASLLTDVPGCSHAFERAFVTYSNEAKQAELGVPAALLATYGAVSEPVAAAMAQGAVQQSAAQVALSVTGVAGPTGGSVEKPVGTVWFGWQLAGQTLTEHHLLAGDRAQVRAQTVQIALAGLLQRLQAAG